MLNEICDIALQAGEISLRYYGNPGAVAAKEGGSLVTEADVKANECIVKGLTKLDSSIPVISEESPIPPYETRRNWHRFWLVDPLDGTAEFVDRRGDFTVNIALIEAGEPVLGVIYAPVRRTLYYAEKGKGSWKKEYGKTAQRIFSCDPGKKGPLIVVGSLRHGIAELDAYLQSFQVERKISIGSSLKFCLVAEGLADLYPRLGPTMEWDVAAGDCIYRNSARNGYRKTTLRYNKPDLKNGNFVIGAAVEISGETHSIAGNQ